MQQTFFLLNALVSPLPSGHRRSALLTPWMNATLVDFYFNVALISVWVWTREKSKAMGLFWILVRKQANARVSQDDLDEHVVHWLLRGLLSISTHDNTSQLGGTITTSNIFATGISHLVRRSCAVWVRVARGSTFGSSRFGSEPAIRSASCSWERDWTARYRMPLYIPAPP